MIRRLLLVCTETAGEVPADAAGEVVSDASPLVGVHKKRACWLRIAALGRAGQDDRERLRGVWGVVAAAQLDNVCDMLVSFDQLLSEQVLSGMTRGRVTSHVVHSWRRGSLIWVLAPG
jgi:hypothetical protein